jgi:ACS family hexuronate transporter-like MFS transporter
MPHRDPEAPSAMPVPIPDVRLPDRFRFWKWWVCGLLLLATTVNYMDRQTLSQLAVRIKSDFHMDNSDYATVESAFALAFAMGGLAMGWLADRINVRWLYPAAVLVWSGAGFVTGYAQGFSSLLICRFLLGLAEAGNWPCALRTTQRILQPEERTMGNSILQSGAAVGAILTPLIVLALVRRTDTWRYPFLLIGSLGLVWAVLWLLSVRSRDLSLKHVAPPDVAANGAPQFRAAGVSALAVRRFLVLMVLVVCINATWHFFRAWLPLILQEQYGYNEEQVGWFTTLYYLSTDAGSLAAGFATLLLARRGMSVHGSRVSVFFVFALITSLAVVAAFLQSGMLLLVLFLVIGFGSLGVFPNYYTFSQELTVRHQGKVTGGLTCTCWLAMAGWQKVIGWLVQGTGSHAIAMVLAGLMPMLGFLVLILFWGPTAPAKPLEVPAPTDTEAGVPDARITTAEPIARSVRPG